MVEDQEEEEKEEEEDKGGCRHAEGQPPPRSPCAVVSLASHLRSVREREEGMSGLTVL